MLIIDVKIPNMSYAAVLVTQRLCYFLQVDLKFTLWLALLQYLPSAPVLQQPKYWLDIQNVKVNIFLLADYLCSTHIRLVWVNTRITVWVSLTHTIYFVNEQRKTHRPNKRYILWLLWCIGGKHVPEVLNPYLTRCESYMDQYLEWRQGSFWPFANYVIVRTQDIHQYSRPRDCNPGPGLLSRPAVGAHAVY